MIRPLARVFCAALIGLCVATTVRADTCAPVLRLLVQADPGAALLRPVLADFDPDPVLSDRDVRKAVPVMDLNGQPALNLRFSDEASVRFAQITTARIGQNIAIVIGDELISAPRVMTEIAGGEAVIAGSFTLEEVSALAETLTQPTTPCGVS